MTFIWFLHFCQGLFLRKCFLEFWKISNKVRKFGWVSIFIFCWDSCRVWDLSSQTGHLGSPHYERPFPSSPRRRLQLRDISYNMTCLQLFTCSVDCVSVTSRNDFSIFYTLSAHSILLCKWMYVVVIFFLNETQRGL